ncbi:hypothetical protein C8J56DRAFT_908480 [Mycena floridula]|nr:hypothetical protein C8J56DRAFT_908480 [Mycena floridula]
MTAMVFWLLQHIVSYWQPATPNQPNPQAAVIPVPAPNVEPSTLIYPICFITPLNPNRSVSDVQIGFVQTNASVRTFEPSPPAKPPQPILIPSSNSSAGVKPPDNSILDPRTWLFPSQAAAISTLHPF